MHKKSKNGFTLVEILVVITITIILFVGASKINFNRMGDKQQSLMFTNNVYSSIETVRNNSLLGKGVGTGLINPTKTTVDISTANSGSVVVKYFSGSSVIRTESGVSLIPFSSISSITCSTINYTSTGNLSSIGITFDGNTLSLSGCTTPAGTGSIIDLKTKYKSFENTIRINSISGVMERL